jgi:hypothetical protein
MLGKWYGRKKMVVSNVKIMDILIKASNGASDFGKFDNPYHRFLS